MEKDVKDLRLILPLQVYRKMMAYVTICNLEISGFAEVEYNAERHAFVAGDVYLLKQEVSGAATHMDEETVAAFNLERIKAGAEQLPRLWWHSHVNMAAFFSTIDEDTLKDLQNDSFIIALVLNKKKDMKAKAYVYQEIKKKVMGIELSASEWVELDPLPVTIELDYEKIPEVLKREVERKVTTKIYKAPKYTPPKGESKLPGGNFLLGTGKTAIVRALRLPRDPEAAMTRIEQLNLERTWDNDCQDFVYIDKTTGNIWVDYWQAVEDLSPWDRREDN